MTATQQTICLFVCRIPCFHIDRKIILLFLYQQLDTVNPGAAEVISRQTEGNKSGAIDWAIWGVFHCLARLVSAWYGTAPPPPLHGSTGYHFYFLFFCHGVHCEELKVSVTVSFCPSQDLSLSALPCTTRAS